MGVLASLNFFRLKVGTVVRTDRFNTTTHSEEKLGDSEMGEISFLGWQELAFRERMRVKTLTTNVEKSIVSFPWCSGRQPMDHNTNTKEDPPPLLTKYTEGIPPSLSRKYTEGDPPSTQNISSRVISSLEYFLCKSIALTVKNVSVSPWPWAHLLRP